MNIVTFAAAPLALPVIHDGDIGYPPARAFLEFLVKYPTPNKLWNTIFLHFFVVFYAHAMYCLHRKTFPLATP